MGFYSILKEYLTRIITNSATPTDLHIITGAEKTLVLDTSVYNDVVTTFDSVRLPSANAPTWSSFIGNLNAYTFAVNDYLEVTSEILHDYKEGTNISVHLHWATNGTNINDRAVKWEIEYSVHKNGYINNIGSVYDTPIIASQETVIPANTPSATAVFSSVATISGTGIKIGAIIKARIRRIASVGTAPTSNPYGLNLGLHYQIDTLGSRVIATK